VVQRLGEYSLGCKPEVARTISYSVVVPARNAEASLARLLEALARQQPTPAEVIVVDDASTDATAAVAERLGARVLRTERQLFAGGARNLGWDAASGDVVVFLDSDVVPTSSWGAGIVRAATDYPGALIGIARTFRAQSRWGWVAHLQVETPYLPRGEPREVAFVSSFCLIMPREIPIRWDESYGGEDALLCAEALRKGIRLVFDPRVVAAHEHGRESFAELRSQQRRFAYGLARAGRVQREGLHKRILSRVPLHYFVLARLIPIERRLRDNPELHRRFVKLLPLMIVAEWSLGLSAVRYAPRRPPLHGAPQPRFT
jgi:glycosyltransferase involved in cell wall biosynthesis